MANKEYNTIVGKLSTKDALFVQKYLETGSKKEAAIEAGYSAATASQAGARIYNKKAVKTEIERQRALLRTTSIATSTEVLDYFTKVMRGEIKDQFGLDAPLSERTRAAVELAKRTVDIDNALEAKKNDTEVHIILDWERKQLGVKMADKKDIYTEEQ